MIWLWALWCVLCFSYAGVKYVRIRRYRAELRHKALTTEVEEGGIVFIDQDGPP